MNFFQELTGLTKNILTWSCFLFLVSCFFFLFPTGYTFSVIVFERVTRDLLPTGVQLIVTNPVSAFLVQMQISLLLAFIVTLPLSIYGMMRYLLPALFEKEKKAIIWILFSSIFLFFVGCLFAYLLLIPLMFRVLYSYTSIINVVPFFSVQEFISSVFGLMIATGVMFLLPIFMVSLNFLNIAEAGFWKDRWHYAFLFFLIFSAIITPDGTGITMMMLTLPLSGLYGLGILLSRK